jgi:hypothetical protein
VTLDDKNLSLLQEVAAIFDGTKVSVMIADRQGSPGMAGAYRGEVCRRDGRRHAVLLYPVRGSLGIAVLDRVVAAASDADAPVVVVAAAVGRDLRTALVGRGLGYLDLAGNRHLEIDGGNVTVHVEGRETCIDRFTAGWADVLRGRLLAGRFRLREREPRAVVAAVERVFHAARVPFGFGGAHGSSSWLRYLQSDETVVHTAAFGPALARELGAVPDRQGPLSVFRTMTTFDFAPDYPTCRGTLDLDLCVAIDLDEHGRAGGLPPQWTRQPGVPHRWRTTDGQLLDILPAADELLDEGRIQWPDGTVTDLTGIDLAMRDHPRYAEDLPGLLAGDGPASPLRRAPFRTAARVRAPRR